MERDFALNVSALPKAAAEVSSEAGAKTLGHEDQVGTIRVGRKADLVIVNGNPVENLKLLFGTGALRLNDASGALARRFLILRLTESFYGREDTTLTEKLLAELPGILNWAIAGWHRLHARGRFCMPQSGADAMLDLEELSSPVSAFVRSECVVGVGQRVRVDDLYEAWARWCSRDGRTVVSTKQTFGRDLVAAFSNVHCRRGSISRFYEGIGLKGGAI